MNTLEIAVVDLGKVEIPPPCACCEASATTAHALRATTQDVWQVALELIGIAAMPPFVRGDLGSRSEHVLAVPLCSTCAGHAQSARRSAIVVAVAVLPVFLVAGLVITIGGAAYDWYPTARTLWPVVLGATALVCGGLWLALLLLTSRTATCTTRRRPVRVCGFGLRGVVNLCFTNQAAARRCLERNWDSTRWCG